MHPFTNAILQRHATDTYNSCTDVHNLDAGNSGSPCTLGLKLFPSTILHILFGDQFLTLRAHSTAKEESERLWVTCDVLLQAYL